MLFAKSIGVTSNCIVKIQVSVKLAFCCIKDLLRFFDHTVTVTVKCVSIDAYDSTAFFLKFLIKSSPVLTVLRYKGNSC